MRERWKEIADWVRASIGAGSLQPGDRLPSETEVAERWGVCRMTAHRAMQELQQAGWVTRKRRRGTIVAEPRLQRQKVVALLFYHMNDFPQVDYINGIRAGLPDAIDLLVCDTHSDSVREAQYLRRMQHETDGILCLPTCAPQNTELLNSLIASGTALVCVDRIPALLPADAFLTDNQAAVLNALRSALGQGHHRIAYFGYERYEGSTVRERYLAYQQVMAEAGHSDPSRWVCQLPKGTGYDFERLARKVFEALREMRLQREAPTALFCEDDYLMAAALESCEQQGLVLNRDVALYSFCDCPILIPRLVAGVNRLSQQAHRMGRLAAQRLDRRLNEPDLPTQVERLLVVYHPATFAPLAPKDTDNKQERIRLDDSSGLYID